MASCYLIKSVVTGEDGAKVECLLPVDSLGHRIMNRLKLGALVRCDIRRQRNIKHHRLFYVLMHTIHQNLPHRWHNIYPTEKSLIDAIKLEVGCFETVTKLSGEVERYPGSIAWNKMGQDEFNEFFDRVCDLVILHFYPEMKSRDLRMEVEQLTGIRLEE